MADCAGNGNGVLVQVRVRALPAIRGAPRREARSQGSAATLSLPRRAAPRRQGPCPISQSRSRASRCGSTGSRCSVCLIVVVDCPYFTAPLNERSAKSALELEMHPWLLPRRPVYRPSVAVACSSHLCQAPSLSAALDSLQ